MLRASSSRATAATAAETEWGEIALLYERLNQMASSPVVELNRAVAIAMAEGPEAGLLLVDEIEERGALDGYYLLHATRADLLRRLGQAARARSAYERALELAPTESERRYLSRRITETRPRARALRRARLEGDGARHVASSPCIG